jgi:RNA polymerase sigma-70 factor (ECF subfamily)
MAQSANSEDEAHLFTLQKENENAFMEAVFRRYYTPLGRTVNRMVNDQQATEDILQDVFLKIWNNRKDLSFTFSIKSYLYRAAINAALNYLEKNKRTVGLETDYFPEPSTEGAEDQLHFQELESRVHDAIETLPPACKTIFVLSRYEEMSYKEIAESLQISVKTVENQMGKALRQMRQYLSVYTKHLFSLFL